VVEKSPDAFRTISEAAEELDLPQHVLRFWETRFSTIKPLKRGGGRRYYRPEDVLLLKGIRHLLYDQGFTIKGVQRILKDQGIRYVIAIGEGGSLEHIAPYNPDEPLPDIDDADLPEINGEIVDDLPLLESPRQSPRAEQHLADLSPANILDDADREKLSEVLRQLLDCKRILERAREN
jgi:DNA-binding transcriptional MerR regulator